MLTLNQHGPLRGELTVPGDKSISHRAVMFGSLAKGTTKVRDILDSADVGATLDCFGRLGVSIERTWEKPQDVIIHGAGMRGLYPSAGRVVLYTQNSGTTTRILSGILAPQPFTSFLTGDESVNRRPMKRVIDPLTKMGASIVSMNQDGCAPLRIDGRALHGIDWKSAVASAQVKSAVLCAGLYADAATSFTEPALSRDHTERMLRAFGADVKNDGLTASVRPANELYSPGEIKVPGDISSAAYFIAAALLVPGSDIVLHNVGINPTRDGIIRAARAMGGNIEILNETDTAEPYADLHITASSLHGTVIEKDMIPTLIDELPVIAVMACAASSETVIRDAAELKVKESDRIAAMTENLRAMGADITPAEDGFIIRGGKALHGCAVKSFKDHRIAMSMAVASLLADGETTLVDENCVAISYPSFFDDLSRLQV